MSLPFSISCALRTTSQNFDVPWGPIASYSIIFSPMRESSAMEKWWIFCSIILSYTSDLVDKIWLGFASFSPVSSVTVLPGFAMVGRGLLCFYRGQV